MGPRLKIYEFYCMFNVERNMALESVKRFCYSSQFQLESCISSQALNFKRSWEIVDEEEPKESNKPNLEKLTYEEKREKLVFSFTVCKGTCQLEMQR